MPTTIAFYAVLALTTIPLPGGPPVGMDYLVDEPAHHRLWVPAGNTGNVDVVDTATGKVTPIGGFPTKPAMRPNRPDQGPSSATVGNGVVWIGNRGDNTLCAFDQATLEKRRCLQLATMPDGLAYVAATHEVWATTPREKAIAVLNEDGKGAGAIGVDGKPEGYAVDPIRGLFYTNLEDKDQTLAIDVRSRKVVATWSTGCGKEGPRGISIDVPRRLLLVACAAGAVSLDLAHDGKLVGHVKAGEGLDNPNYWPARALLYLTAGASGTLTIARVANEGALSLISTVPTAKGAQGGEIDADGRLFVADSAGGRLIVVDPPAGP